MFDDYRLINSRAAPY